MGPRSALRSVVVVAGLFCLAGAHLPPASAEGSKTIVFAGSAFVTGGLGYPCTPPGADPLPTATQLVDNDVTKPPPGAENKTCPPDTAVNPTAGKKQKLVEVNGWTRTGSFASDVCVAAGVTLGKGTKAPADGGLCFIGSTFVVTGYCGLSQGEGRATITIDNILGPNQTYGVHYFWFQAGTLFTLRGQAWPGTGTNKPPTPEWSFTGAVRTYLDATAYWTHTSCTNKTGQFFYYDGVADLVHPNPTTLP